MSEKVIPQSSVRVFFNKDCGKYGVEVFDSGTSSSLIGWRQIDTTRELGVANVKNVYTPYKKVADRWRDLFIVYGKRVIK